MASVTGVQSFAKPQKSTESTTWTIRATAATATEATTATPADTQRQCQRQRQPHGASHSQSCGFAVVPCPRAQPICRTARRTSIGRSTQTTSVGWSRGSRPRSSGAARKGTVFWNKKACLSLRCCCLSTVVQALLGGGDSGPARGEHVGWGARPASAAGVRLPPPGWGPPTRSSRLG